MTDLDAMESASCPRCGADEGSYCSEWINGIGTQEQPGLCHPERIAFAAMKLAGRAGSPPSEDAFDSAVMKTGLI